MGGTAEARQEDGQRTWTETYEGLIAAAERAPLDVEDLERLAEAAFFLGRDDESARAWEHAHQVWVRLGDADRAGRCAFWLGFGFMLRGEMARASGWFGRGARVIAELGDDCAARGYLLVPEAMEALEGGDAARAGTLYEQVEAIARRHADADLTAIALLGRGEVAVASGETKAGVALLDEVMVAATTGEVSALTTGILYCAVIDACVQIFDLRRAAEWTDALSRWCERQRDLVPYRGQCLVHRSQVLQAHGEWGDALAEAARAGERLAQPPHPAVGVAYYQQGELHRLRGEFDDAEAAYRRASQHGREPAPGLALLRLAQGEIAAAETAARRMLDQTRDRLGRLGVLPAFVEIMVAAGQVEAAREASDELTTIAAGGDAPLVQAMADHAQTSVLLAERRPAEALEAARRACRRWRELGMPHDGARSQVLVALACRELGDHDTADVELEAAGITFERLGAGPDLEQARAAAQAAAGDLRPETGLTERECEVLRLVAAGKTNREVGEALVISEHTVARHLQNIFTKLGLSSRAAATAWAYEHGVV